MEYGYVEQCNTSVCSMCSGSGKCFASLTSTPGVHLSTTDLITCPGCDGLGDALQAHRLRKMRDRISDKMIRVTMTRKIEIEGDNPRTLSPGQIVDLPVNMGENLIRQGAAIPT